MNTIMLTAMTWVTSRAGSFISRFEEERGQDIMEYAVIAGAIAVAAAIFIFTVGGFKFDTWRDTIQGCLNFDMGKCSGP